MSNTFIILLSILVLDALIIGWVTVSNRRHAVLLGRATESTGGTAAPRRIEIRREKSGRLDRARETLESVLPEGLLGERTAAHLVRAGFDSTIAPAIYGFLRVVSAVTFPVLAVLYVPRDDFWLFVVGVALSAMIGLVFPPAVLSNLEGSRKTRLRRSIPDTLDMLLVCVEAGVSLDAALLRVGRELLPVHPELAKELLVVNRKSNAGMRREDALHGLYDRTGVDELRTLASSLIQSEKWGSSIGRVLRVFSESLRRTRRQSAEKKAATAGPKMIFPMVLFILPALFAVVGGPMLIGLGPVLDVFGK